MGSEENTNNIVERYEVLKKELFDKEYVLLTLKAEFGGEFIESTSFFHCLFERSIPDLLVTHSFDSWYKVEVAPRAYEIFLADVLSECQSIEAEGVGKAHCYSLFSGFVNALSREVSQYGNPWQVAWLVRELASDFSVWLGKVDVEGTLGQRLNDSVLLSDVKNRLLQRLEIQCTSAADTWKITDQDLYNLLIKSFFSTHALSDGKAEQLVLRVFSEEDVRANIRCNWQLSTLPSRLFALQNSIEALTFPSSDEGIVDELCRFIDRVVVCDQDLFKVRLPVSRVLHAAAELYFPDDPNPIKRLAATWERGADSDIAYIFSRYDRQKHPEISGVDAPSVVIDYTRGEGDRWVFYDDENEQMKYAFPEDCPSEVGLEKLALAYYDILEQSDSRDIEDHRVKISTLSYSENVYNALCQQLWRDELSVGSRVGVFGRLVSVVYGSSTNKVDCRDIKADEIRFPEQLHKQLVQAFTIEFEREATKCEKAYLEYVKYCKPHLPRNEYIERFGKCLGLMRRRILNDQTQWLVGDYLPVLYELSEAGRHDHIFKMLLLALRQATPVNDNSAVQVNWALSESEVRQSANPDTALNWLLANWLPKQLMAGDYWPALSQPEEDERAVEQLANFTQLTEVMSAYCISSLQLRKKQKAENGAYLEGQCKEVNPHWRRGYLHALGELRRNKGGHAHKVAHFVHEHDFDTDTRELARLTHKSLRQFKPYKTYQEIHRSYLAALWWLRMARAQAGGVQIDIALAKRWRRRELRHV